MIYLDNASTTQVYEQALEQFNMHTKTFFNPSALYKQGADVLKNINIARKNLLKLLNASSFDNLVFTSGATEANNIAILGAMRKNFKKMVFSVAEHPSVYNVAQNLKNFGVEVLFVNTNADGTVCEQDFRQKVVNADFVSVIHVNNETGAINNIKNLCQIAKSLSPKVLFHSDGVQAFGKIDFALIDLGVDLYSISAHKIHGPKGVGALFIKKGVVVKPVMFGGGQEFNINSGTENVAGIMAFNAAADIIFKNKQNNIKHFELLKNAFVNVISKDFDNFKLHSQNNCVPNIIAFAILGVKSETILHMAEQQGVLISNGSACSSRNTENRILSSMGLDKQTVTSSVRVSFSEFVTQEEVEKAANIIKDVCKDYIKKVGQK